MFSKTFSKFRYFKISSVPANSFFSSPKTELSFDPAIKPVLLHENKFLPFLKGTESFPIEIGKEFHKTKKPVNIFSRSAYLRLMAHEEFKEWKNIFDTYYKAITHGDLEILEGLVERNLYNRVQKFCREFAGTKLELEIIEPKELICTINIVEHRTYKGVFIDRALNQHVSSYYIKETKDQETYEILSGKVLGREQIAKKIEWDKLLDKELNAEYLEKDRSGYTINQYILEVETNRKVIVTREEQRESKPIYGIEEEGFESHYMVIENKRDYFKKFPYYLVDFDFVLNKNPHVMGKK